MTWLAETAMLAHGWRRLLLCALAGAVAGLGVPPLFFLPALFLAFPVWVWCLDGAERRPGWRQAFGPAFRIGFAFGLGHFAVAFHWLGAAFFIEGGVLLLLMPVAILALAALIAIFWGLASALAHTLWSDGPWRIVTLATALAAAEFARGHLFSGFPFDLLGYALTANEEMMQLASVVGVYGLTLLAALMAMTPALIWPGGDRPLAGRLAPFFLALVAIAGQVAFGQYRLNTTAVATRDDLRLRLVQPVIYEHSDWTRVDPAAVVTRLIELSETRTGPSDPGLASIDQLVWPESAFPFFLSEYPDALARIGRMLPETTTLLVGGPREDYGADGLPLRTNPGYNAILAIDGAGEVVASYDKSHLVPFGEFLPFPEVFAALGIRQFVPGANGWAPGTGRRLMSLPGAPPFLALICYEAIFSGDLGPDVSNADYLLNITNDAWFDGSIGPAQHAHHVRLRAVEEGMALVRAANSGITMLVDPLGRVTARLAEQQMAVLDVSPARRLADTVFARLRHLPFAAALALGAAIAVLSSRKLRRKRA